MREKKNFALILLYFYSTKLTVKYDNEILNVSLDKINFLA